AEVLSEVIKRGNLPLLVGGTGLYIRALLGGFSFAGRADASARQRWQELIASEGMEAAASELEGLDQQAAATIDVKNPRRLLRALEAATGPGPSVADERSRLWSPKSKYRVHSFGLDPPREELYRIIDKRVDAMFSGGVVEEVREALKGEVSRTACQAIGFKEIQCYLEGELTLDEARAAIRQKSRRYAKRQLTWMRKMPDIVRIGMAGRDYAAAATSIIEQIQAVYAV
ncbi:MAG: tRNA dimethylallyltransferase, partial [Actinomycetota bacterium]